jgi:hypothetical protein
VRMHGKLPVRQLLAYAQTTLLILGQDLLASFNYYQRPREPSELASRSQLDAATMPA